MAAISGKATQRISVDVATSGDNTVITFPTTGGFDNLGPRGAIHVTHFILQNTSDTAYTVIVKDGTSTNMNGDGFLLAANGGSMSFDGGPTPLVLSSKTDLVLNVSVNAKQLSGWIIYYIE